MRNTPGAKSAPGLAPALYSALVFQGPELVQEILSGLSRKLAEKNLRR